MSDNDKDFAYQKDIWLPPQVIIKLGGVEAKWKHICILERKNSVTFYVEGELVIALPRKQG